MCNLFHSVVRLVMAIRIIMPAMTNKRSLCIFRVSSSSLSIVSRTKMERLHVLKCFLIRGVLKIFFADLKAHRLAEAVGPYWKVTCQFPAKSYIWGLIERSLKFRPPQYLRSKIRGRNFGLKSKFS